MSTVNPMPSTMMLGPIATMADYVPLEHPRIDDLRRRAQVTIKGLRRVADYAKTRDADIGAWGSQKSTEEASEAWRVSLRHMRATQTELESGLATRRFMRELRADAPDLYAAFDRARLAAIDAFRECRAFAAVMADERDDEDLGIEVLPPIAEDAPREVGPSVDFDW